VSSVHPEGDLAALTSPDREHAERGVHVVVHVTADGNTAYARVNDPASQGHRSQRWLTHARRGSSPGGWSEEHHPRSEQHVGHWKQRHAAALDRALIGYSKQAWRLGDDAPYVVEFPVVPLAELGIDVS
jgi:hypothetical protein